MPPRTLLTAVVWLSAVASASAADAPPAALIPSTAPAATRPHDHGDEVDLGTYRYEEGVTVPANLLERPLAKLELKDRIYHGVLLYTDNKTTFDQRYAKYVKQVGVKPSMIGCFHARYHKGVEQPEELFLNRLKYIDSYNVVPFIKLYTGDWYPPGPVISADAILAGKEDAYFGRMAEMSRQFGKPFMLSINHEMNGDWFKFSELYKKDGGTDWTAPKFIEVWRRIHRIFQEKGATNVAFAWCPGVKGRNYKDLDAVNSHKAYYPGDEYVDWVGGSFYNDVNHKFIDSIASAYPNKPFILAEWGTEGHRGVWYQPKPYPGDVKWLQMTFEILPKRYPNLKAVTYFYWGKGVDLERVPGQVEVYKQGIANPRFLHNP